MIRARAHRPIVIGYRLAVVWAICLLVSACGKEGSSPYEYEEGPASVRFAPQRSPGPIEGAARLEFVAPVPDADNTPDAQGQGSRTRSDLESSEGRAANERSLTEALLGDDAERLLQPAAVRHAAAPAHANVDPGRIALAGIRKLVGKHLTLYTDLPSEVTVDQLPAVFDQSVPQWADYFRVPRQRTRTWRLVGYLIRDKVRFQAIGLFPDNLPPFLHGYQRGKEFWLYEQPSDYYRRHLLLHEGTHAFVNRFLGGSGPPWYMEGVAELLATHRWQDGILTLRYFPKSKEEVPHWGRIKTIKDQFAAHRGLMINQIIRYDRHAHLKLEPYAWCWGIAAFLDNHPRYQRRFRELHKDVKCAPSEFNRRLESRLQDELRELDEQWQLFIVNLEYGYDFRRAAVQYKPGSPLPAGGAEVIVAADRGWQSTGYRLKRGVTYRITAVGRYQLTREPEEWWSEPNGVTIRYHRGRPLGLLMGKVRPAQANSNVALLTKPRPLGSDRRLVAERSGTLYLCINDSPAELADNLGTLTVRIERQGERSVTGNGR